MNKDPINSQTNNSMVSSLQLMAHNNKSTNRNLFIGSTNTHKIYQLNMTQGRNQTNPNE